MKLQVNIPKTVTAVLMAGTVLFYWLMYPAHVRFQEQYQLFEFTRAYFIDTVSVPGGFADWCGRLLTQFYLFPLAGAVIMAALVLLMQRLSFRLLPFQNITAFILSWMPAVCLFAFFLSDTSLTGAAVAILLPMASSVAVRRIPKGTYRCIAIFLFVAVLYILCGPAAILFSVLLPEDEPVSVRVSAPLFMVLCPLGAQFLFHYPLEKLFLGVHYGRIPSQCPVIMWLTVLSVTVICLLSRLAFRFSDKMKSHKVITLLSGAFTAVLGFVLISLCIDLDRERTMQYESAVRYEDWNSVIDMAEKDSPRNTVTLACLNLALAKTGRLPERQFSYPQAGEKGLFPSYSINYTSLLTASEIYWHLGAVNACQQYVFDAQEAIPDYQKSARCYRRLAETFLINGDYKVAEKYLNALSHTLFYRGWAINARKLINSPESIASHPVYGEKRRLRECDAVMLFNENNKFTMCAALLRRNSENKLAGDYLYSLLLLEKDFEGFRKIFRPEKYGVLPKHYQEALILMCVNDRKPLDSVSELVQEKNLKRMAGFIGDMKAHASEQTMHKKYGDTYWYYALFE